MSQCEYTNVVNHDEPMIWIRAEKFCKNQPLRDVQRVEDKRLFWWGPSSQTFLSTNEYRQNIQRHGPSLPEQGRYIVPFPLESYTAERWCREHPDVFAVEDQDRTHWQYSSEHGKYINSEGGRVVALPNQCYTTVKNANDNREGLPTEMVDLLDNVNERRQNIIENANAIAQDADAMFDACQHFDERLSALKEQYAVFIEKTTKGIESDVQKIAELKQQNHELHDMLDGANAAIAAHVRVMNEIRQKMSPNASNMTDSQIKQRVVALVDENKRLKDTNNLLMCETMWLRKPYRHRVIENTMQRIKNVLGISHG